MLLTLRMVSHAQPHVHSYYPQESEWSVCLKAIEVILFNEEGKSKLTDRYEGKKHP